MSQRDERGPYNPSVYLTEDRRSALDRIAESRRTLVERKDALGKPFHEEVKPTRQDLIREAVDEFLERHKQEAQLQAPTPK